ncbi:unnamed protein product [Nezara viridula]|uniref:Uncharacterized protein n=1 Tax=Nezara viridula TaxID=85310 RepID=A0A9P0E8X7_NEZVI|nr:unnamed protein product [Nezara viridula]
MESSRVTVRGTVGNFKGLVAGSSDNTQMKYRIALTDGGGRLRCPLTSPRPTANIMSQLVHVFNGRPLLPNALRFYEHC